MLLDTNFSSISKSSKKLDFYSGEICFAISISQNAIISLPTFICDEFFL